MSEFFTASYDAQNRLLSATRGTGGGADTMEVVYDPWNRPIYRTVNGQRLYYVWDGWDLVAERTESQNQTGDYEKVYIHGAGVDEILTTQQGYGGARRYHHHDALGSVIALSDDTGALIKSYTFDAFGTPQVFDAAGLPVSSTAYGNRFLYTGREWIAELSLYDYRNRVYSAELGRFLQTDPIRFAAGDVNLYRYVGNGAAFYRDPHGLFVLNGIGALIGGVVGGVTGYIASGGDWRAAAGGAVGGAVSGALFNAAGVAGAGTAAAAAFGAGAAGGAAGSLTTSALNGTLASNPGKAAAQAGASALAGGTLGAVGGLGANGAYGQSLISPAAIDNLVGGLTGGAQGLWGAFGEMVVAPAFPDKKDSDADGQPDEEDHDDDNDGLDDNVDDDDDGDNTPDELDKDHPSCPLNPNFGK